VKRHTGSGFRSLLSRKIRKTGILGSLLLIKTSSISDNTDIGVSVLRDGCPRPSVELDDFELGLDPKADGSRAVSSSIEEPYMTSQILEGRKAIACAESGGSSLGRSARRVGSGPRVTLGVLLLLLHACQVMAEPPSGRPLPNGGIRLTEIPAPPPPAPPGGNPPEEAPIPPIPALPEAFGRDQVRLPTLPEAGTPLGRTPVPSAETLRKFGRYIDRVIDPENTFDAIVGRPRVLVLKQVPVRFQLEEEQIARIIPFFENKQLSITGLRVGTTILNLWFGDPNDPAGQTVLSFLVRVLPDPEARQRLERVYDALAREVNKLFPNSVVRLSLAGDKLVVSGQAKDIVEATNILRVVRANTPGGGGGGAGAGAGGGGGGAGAGGVGGTAGAVAQIPLGPQVTTTGINPLTGGLMAVTTPAEAPAGTLPTLDNYVLAGGPNIINLLRVPGEQQIMLRVTVAEVNRTAARSIGVNFNVLNAQKVVVFGSTLTGLSGAITSTTPSGAGNIVAVLDNGLINAAITALRNLNFARTLAEPNLTTTNGQVANFLAGGEFPVPVTSGTTFTGLQGVQYVPFGVQLRFIPYITDKDRVRLVVSSVVSTRDVSTGATIGGASVSGLNTRNFSTTVELRDGQTLAVAGLIQNSYGATALRVPFFGDLPIVGRLFAQDGASSSEQELVILVTPVLVHPYDPHQVPPLPGSDIFEPGDLEFFLLGRLEGRRPYDYRAGVRTDIHRMARYRHCEDIFITGPHGYSPGPP
jgi:pilus assembly protein CpaC